MFSVRARLVANFSLAPLSSCPCLLRCVSSSQQIMQGPIYPMIKRVRLVRGPHRLNDRRARIRPSYINYQAAPAPSPADATQTADPSVWEECLLFETRLIERKTH